MLLPQKKERSYRFKLALRMGLPIFGLVLILISNRLIANYENLEPSFFIIAIILIVFNIYFIFYIIYESFDIRITDPITKTFTREYLYKYLKNKISKDYTLVLISIDNLSDINSRYGIKNGDIVLKEVALWIAKYLYTKDIENFPMGHLKGGDFIIGLDGHTNSYATIVELICIRGETLKINDIEIKLSSSMVDTTFSNELDYLVEELFEQQQNNRNQKNQIAEIAPNELESFVINAIKKRSFSVMSQDIFENDERAIKEYFIKLLTPDEKIIQQKTYMKILDRLGIMIDFDLMILEHNVTKCLKSSDLPIAMNISPSSLRNPIFIHRAKDILNSNVEIKNKIIFILSETQYYSNIDRYNTTLKTFRDMGVLIAIDRLGAINTSFLYLRDLEIDMVRFDPYYLKDIENDKYINIIKGFNLMAHEKSIKTWVKMVESQNIKIKIEELGIDFIQGKYLAPVEKKNEI